jgi:heptosyltransferase-3
VGVNTSMNTAKPKVAIIPVNTLGDSLAYLPLSHNLYLNGYQVTVFSNFLQQLKSLSPHLRFAASLTQAQAQQVLPGFDLVIFEKNKRMPIAYRAYHPQQRYLLCSERPLANSPTQCVQNVVLEQCCQMLNLSLMSQSNGLQYPNAWRHNAYYQRVIIHPTSSAVKKNWPLKKFVRLAYSLREQGYDPVFSVSPSEYAQVRSEIPLQFTVEKKSTILELARLLYESGYVIGNDSGVTHLASHMNIPTLTIHYRKQKAQRWRPAYYPGQVVLPTLVLPVIRFWKPLLTVRKVIDAFQQLVTLEKTKHV